MKTFLEFIKGEDLPFLDEVWLCSSNDDSFELLREGKQLSGRFPKNIRLDHPTYGAGMTHGHVHGRKGDQIVVVNIDGTASHGTKGRLHDLDAAALRASGFKLRDDNIVEWFILGSHQNLLLEINEALSK